MIVDEYDGVLAREIRGGSAALLPRWTAAEDDSSERVTGVCPD
jgi:hypothetical protein